MSRISHLLIFVSLCIFTSINAQQQVHNCPPNTFTCDQACIRCNWRCDGEPDCINGEDEVNCANRTDNCVSPGASVIAPQAQLNPVQIAAPQSISGSGNIGDNDPEAAAQTIRRLQQASAVTPAATETVTITGVPLAGDDYYYNYDDDVGPIIYGFEDGEACDQANAQVVALCMQRINDWMNLLGAIKPRQAYVSDSANEANAVSACEIFADFRTCLGDLYADPGSCIPPKTFEAWKDLDTYMCQLLVPTSQEAKKSCFANSTGCVSLLSGAQALLRRDMCPLLQSVSMQLQCMTEECKTDEMVMALQSETQALDQLYTCTKDEVIPEGCTRAPQRLIEDCSEFIMPVINIVRNPAETLLSHPKRMADICTGVQTYGQCLVRKERNRDCWPKDAEFVFLSVIVDVYCDASIMKQFHEDSECFEKLHFHDITTQCRRKHAPDAKKHPGNDVCSAINILVNVNKCLKPAVSEECGADHVQLFDSIREKAQAQKKKYNCDQNALAAAAKDTTTQCFPFNPKFPKCTEDQDDAGAGCLLSLFSLMDLAGQLPNINIIEELANPDSEITKKLCGAWEEYAECQDNDMYGDTGRCSSSLPLNEAPRLGLADLCSAELKKTLADNTECLNKLSPLPEVKKCVSNIGAVMGNIGALLGKGTNANLCEIVYAVKDIFLCVRQPTVDNCGEATAVSMDGFVDKLTKATTDTGCPAERPADFQSCLNPKKAPKVNTPKPTTTVAPISAGQCFPFNPAFPACTEDQNDAGAGCLLSLFSLMDLAEQLPNINIIDELANPESEITTQLCGAWEEYSTCQNEDMYGDTGRCSSSLPLNEAPRLGLADLCSTELQTTLAENKDCLKALSPLPSVKKCVSNIGGVMANIGALLGKGTIANLCEIVYAVKDIFICVRQPTVDTCGEATAASMDKFITKLTKASTDTGCPADRPANMAECLKGKKAVTQKQQIGTTTEKSQAGAGDVEIVGCQRAVLFYNDCSSSNQEATLACMAKMGALTVRCNCSPHPYLIVDNPPDIAKACVALEDLKACTSPCKLDWMRGIEASWTYVCTDEGLKRYDQYSFNPTIKKCTADFTNGEKGSNCDSATLLAACVVPIIKERCTDGDDHAQFVQDVLDSYSAAGTKGCGTDGGVPKDTEGTAEAGVDVLRPSYPINCDADETAKILKCEEPLNPFKARIISLFDGGITAILSGLEKLGPLFAEACEKSLDFKSCADEFITKRPSDCRISSCLIGAGDGICDQADPATEIKRHLDCMFTLVADQTFTGCLGTHLLSAGELDIVKLQKVLPKFVQCATPVIVGKCGQEPVNVLNAFGADPYSCVIGGGSANQTEGSSPKLTCTAAGAMCTKSYLNKDQFSPVSILAEFNPAETCANAVKFTSCLADKGGADCAPETAGSNLGVMISAICTEEPYKSGYEKYGDCLAEVMSEREDCLVAMITSPPEDGLCGGVQAVVDCVQADLIQTCGKEALMWSASTMTDYISAEQKSACTLKIEGEAVIGLSAPEGSSNAESESEPQAEGEPLTERSLPVGCTPEVQAKFTDCHKQHYSGYGLIPIVVLSNVSKLDEICDRSLSPDSCTALPGSPCASDVSNLATNKTVAQVCGTKRFESGFREAVACVSGLLNHSSMQYCQAPLLKHEIWSDSDLLCNAFDRGLRCAKTLVVQECGPFALIHIYSVHSFWINFYSLGCTLNMNSDALNPSLHPVCDDAECEELICLPTNPDCLISASAPCDQFKCVPVIAEGVDADAEPEAEPKPEGESELKVDGEPKAQPEVRSFNETLEWDSDNYNGTKPEPEPETGAEPESVAEGVPEAESNSTASVEPEAEAEAETVAEPELRAEGKNDTLAEPESEPTAEAPAQNDVGATSPAERTLKTTKTTTVKATTKPPTTIKTTVKAPVVVDEKKNTESETSELRQSALRHNSSSWLSALVFVFIAGRFVM